MIDSSAPPQVACMTGYTFDEFCAVTGYADLLRSRYQEVNIPIEVQQYLVDFPEWLNWVVVVEEDEPDSLVILPILQRMAEFAPRSSIYILSAEDDLTLVDGVLEEIDLSDDDLVEADLPLLFFCSDEWQLLSQWGPRPQAVEPLLDQWLEQKPEFATLAESEDEAEQQAHAQLLDELTYEMRVWYISELDHECCNEVKAVLETVAVELEGDELDDADTTDEENQPSEPDEEYAPIVGIDQDDRAYNEAVAADDDDGHLSSASDESSQEPKKGEASAASKPNNSSRKPRNKNPQKETRSKRNERRPQNRSGTRSGTRSSNRRPNRSNSPDRSTDKS